MSNWFDAAESGDEGALAALVAARAVERAAPYGNYLPDAIDEKDDADHVTPLYLAILRRHPRSPAFALSFQPP